MFCSGSRFENVRAGPASYVVFGARKLTSKRSRSGNAVRSQRCVYPSNIELRTSVYPSNFAPIGLKLWENAFQTICNFRFFNSEKKISTPKKIVEAHFFFKNCFFWKIWPSKSGYRHLRRPKSLPRMRFSSLYDASPARTINFCVLLLDFGRKKTSIER